MITKEECDKAMQLVKAYMSQQSQLASARWVANVERNNARREEIINTTPMYEFITLFLDLSGNNKTVLLKAVTIFFDKEDTLYIIACRIKEMTISDIIKTPGCGSKRLFDILTALAEFNIFLKD